MASIDEKMAKMRLKNLELLKRHQEIEEDRQRAEQSGATKNNVVFESTNTRTRKNRIRAPPMIYSDKNQVQDSKFHESTRRRSTALRRKLDQTAPSIDFNQPDPDEPLYAKKRIIIHNQVDQIGSGRFSQLQHKRVDNKFNEGIHRFPSQNHNSTHVKQRFDFDSSNVKNGFHNQSTTPIQFQLVSPTGERLDHSTYLHQNYLHSSSNPSSTMSTNKSMYFAPPANQFTRSFDNSNRSHSFHSTAAYSKTNGYRTTAKIDDSLNTGVGRFQSSSSNLQPYRFQKQHQTTTTNLPLSAYMNIGENDDSFKKQRKSNLNKIHNQDKYQFPLSSYDPHQYRFQHPMRNNFTRRQPNANRKSNDGRIIEEWWEDNIATTLMGRTAETSDDKNQDQLLKSIDQLQQQLKLEEAFDECLKDSDIDSIKRSGTYNTAHFLQWAKKAFREELSGRLITQDIDQHDAVTQESELNQGDTHFIDYLPTDFEQKLAIDINQAND